MKPNVSYTWHYPVDVWHDIKATDISHWMEGTLWCGALQKDIIEIRGTRDIWVPLVMGTWWVYSKLPPPYAVFYTEKKQTTWCRQWQITPLQTLITAHSWIVPSKGGTNGRGYPDQIDMRVTSGLQSLHIGGATEEWLTMKVLGEKATEVALVLLGRSQNSMALIHPAPVLQHNLFEVAIWQIDSINYKWNNLLKILEIWVLSNMGRLGRRISLTAS